MMLFCFVPFKQLSSKQQHPSPEAQAQRTSALSQQQLQRHRQLLEEFIIAGGGRVSPEIMKAAKGGLRDLQFEQADAQLKYRFVERVAKKTGRSLRAENHALMPRAKRHKGSRNDAIAPPAANDNGKEKKKERIQLSQGTERQGILNREMVQPDSETNMQIEALNNGKGESELMTRFNQLPTPKKTSSSSKGHLPNLQEIGLYNKRSLGEKIKLAFTEPGWLMRKMKFPEVAFKDVYRLEILDDLASTSGIVR